MLRLIKIIVDKNKPSPSLIVGKSSIHELGVSHVRAIVQELDEKVYELSTISEQIPQL